MTCLRPPQRRLAPATACSAALLLSSVLAGPAFAAPPACDAKLLSKLAVPVNTTLSGAKLLTSAGVDYCEVSGVIGPAPSRIGFSVGLPTKNWNGRFVMSGDGGFDGTVDLPKDRLAQGYAVANSDSGHAKPPKNDASWAFNNRVTERDYGYRAAEQTTRVAKQIIQSFYRERIAYSYFEGCSTGGRQALMAAQRDPDAFDGIVGGSPAFDLTKLAVEQNWSLRQFLPDQGKPGPGTISVAQSLALKAAVLDKCDANDGVKDGLISNPLACHFRAEEMSCAAGADPKTCLSDAQVQAVQNVYDGPSTSWGKSLYPGKPVGSEAGWQFWLLPPLNFQGGFTFSFMNYLFFQKDPGPAPGYNWFDFNFDTDPPKGRLMAEILDAVDPDLSDFRRHGGKFILYHGWGDGLIGAQRTVQYYESVLDEFHSRRKTENTIRLFLAPGMDHCGLFESGLSSWDRLAPLVQWVEKGVAPERIVAAQTVKGAVIRTRPLCPYPQEARWTGQGSTDDAANFVCARPPQEHENDQDHHHGYNED
jgi:pimeloyl-ACP methyl ester carboxylesterase